MEVLKVSGKSVPKSVGGAIASILRRGEKLEVQAIGPAAVNQSVKSIAVARNYVQHNGIELVSVPIFKDFLLDGKEHTAIVFQVANR
jgi:stage V sporulation protein S